MLSRNCSVYDKFGTPFCPSLNVSFYALFKWSYNEAQQEYNFLPSIIRVPYSCYFLGMSVCSSGLALASDTPSTEIKDVYLDYVMLTGAGPVMLAQAILPVKKGEMTPFGISADTLHHNMMDSNSVFVLRLTKQSPDPQYILGDAVVIPVFTDVYNPEEDSNRSPR